MRPLPAIVDGEMLKFLHHGWRRLYRRVGLFGTHVSHKGLVFILHNRDMLESDMTMVVPDAPALVRRCFCPSESNRFPAQIDQWPDGLPAALDLTEDAPANSIP